MGVYLTKIIAGSLIIANSIFAFPNKTYGLEKVVAPPSIEKTVGNSTEIKQEAAKIPVEKSRIKLKTLGGGGNFDQVGNKGNIVSKFEYGKFRFGVSYDHADIKGNSKSDRSLLTGNIEYFLWKNTNFGMIMNSEMNIGFQTTLIETAFQKQLGGLYLKGAAGVKIGSMNAKQETEDIFGIKGKYKLPLKKSLIFQVEGGLHVPRKYLQDRECDLWSGEFGAEMSYKLTEDLSVGFKYQKGRDVIPIVQKIIEKEGFTLNFIYGGN